MDIKMKKVIVLVFLICLYFALPVFPEEVKNKDNYLDYLKSAIKKEGQADYAGAVQDLNKATLLNPKSGYAYQLRGTLKFKLKDYTGAIPDLTKAIELLGDKHDNFELCSIYHKRAISKINLKDYTGVIQDYTEIINREPENAGVYELRGGFRAKVKDFKGAIEDLEKAKNLYLKQNKMSSYEETVLKINKVRQVSSPKI